jgi:zinc protease
MKRFTKFLFVFVVAAVCSIPQIFAQQMPSIPTDSAVRIGKLSNGLTYYIRKNTLPEKRAFFYIAQKVGSIQEEPQQRGLAHFLEHMCFNGTKHFPGDALKQYLEKIGVKFGENLNAYTSVDETVYNIDNVPVTTPGAIDSCLLILHDWSNDLTLDPKEIDKERGVINEEWRLRRTAQQRLWEAATPTLMKDSKYSDCMPIGTMDVVMHFKPQTLRDYYEKWYRPDLQGVIVVGDINVDEMEAKIKKIFADIPAQPNAAKRIYYPVADNQDPLVFIGQDKEQPNITSLVFFKHDATPDSLKTSMAYYMQQYAADIINRMLSARFDEILHKANPPFVYAGTYDGGYFLAKTKDAFTGYVGCKENEIGNGVSALIREILRAKQFGFTKTEYNRARADYLRSLESLYNDRDKQESDKFVSKYVNNFLDNEPIPSIAQDYQIASQIAPNIPVELINQMLPQLISDHNMAVMLEGPEKQGLKLPTQAELMDVINKVKAEKLTAYVDKVSDQALMTVKPKPGRIVSTKKNAVTGNTEMVLSNGAKVIIKKTDFKKDEINMEAISKGGSSLFPAKDAIQIQNMDDVIALGGVGKFSTVDLDKVLAGKKASASASVDASTESVEASCSPKDLETMMQLVYLRFTAPRKDIDAFESYKTRMKANLKNQELQPETALSDTLMKAIYNNDPRVLRMKENMVDKINYDQILAMYKDRFKDASDFTFFFVGNVDVETLKPLIAQYIASLPAIHRIENYKGVLYTRKGLYTNNFMKAQESPKAYSMTLFSGDIPYNQQNRVTADMLGQILTIIYTKTVREDASAAYYVSAHASCSYYPKQECVLQVFFPTAPEKLNMAVKLINEGYADLMKKGPSAETLNKVKEFMLKKHAEDLKENSYWMSVLTKQYVTNLDISKNYEAVVKGTTAKQIQDFASALYKQNNHIVVSMSAPAAAKK